MIPLSTTRPRLGLAAWIGLSFLPSLTGVLFPPGPWYQELAKPTWTPPGWLFGPAWTFLYLTMGIAAWRVWRRAPRSGALRLFLAQLVLNAAWTPLFFGLQRPDLALAEILLLVLAVAATLVAFWPIDRLAGVLLVPYLAWLGFATALNAAIWSLAGAG